MARTSTNTTNLPVSFHFLVKCNCECPRLQFTIQYGHRQTCSVTTQEDYFQAAGAEVDGKWSGGGKKSQEGGHERLGYLVSCLKQYTQKRCPHCAWKGFLRTSLHFWHWYLGSMDTDRTRWGIPGKEESIEEGKEGRAITFHLPSMLIILKKNRKQKHTIYFTYNMNSSELVNDWIALI